MANNIRIAVVNALANSVIVFDSAKEALAAFEAAEKAVLILTTYDLVASRESDQVRKDLGLNYQLGQWPWYEKEGARTYQGRAYWYGCDPSIFTMEKGRVSSSCWERGFDALMLAKGW